uniref:Squalene synthase n=2 Tax=Physcomitrium patens TaxID=3218 RepID=A0A7I4FQR3_PHYPA
MCLARFERDSKQSFKMGIIGAILKNPEDLHHLLKLKMASAAANRAIPSDPNLAFCYQMLRRVSGSFSIVILQLEPGLRNAVCVFYLVLRGLQAVDDLTIPYDLKVELLRNLHKKIFDRDFHFPCGNNDYKLLMDKFYLVILAFLGLTTGYQEVITEITERMGEGMVKYLNTEIISREDYNEYCHFSAGLMGLGLTRIFYTAGMEQFTPDYLSNAMGLFLQKTNVIRDYLENINAQPTSRLRWPKEVWSKYADKPEAFMDETNYKQGLHCLNEMVTDALSHGLDCLHYMAALQDQPNLRFCATFQITALGTLAMCYNNVEVFRGSVRMRRGLTAKILDVKNMVDVYGAFYDFTRLIAAKIDKTDPSAVTTHKFVDDIRSICRFEIKNRRAFTIESKFGHETFLVVALFVILVIMLLIVTKQ